MRGTTHRRYYKAGALATGVIALLISGAILGWRGDRLLARRHRR